MISGNEILFWIIHAVSTNADEDTAHWAIPYHLPIL